MIEEITGSMRNSILALIVFFLIGLTFLLRSMILKSREDAEGNLKLEI